MAEGESLELRVYEAIKKSIVLLGLNPNSCKVHHQKGYFSQMRDKIIKVDVSIEVYSFNSQTPSILWVWECKDYERSIPVGEIEKFHAVLEQIGADKTKGTIICSNGAFDRSAWEYAKSLGIGLTRLMPDGQIYGSVYGLVPTAGLMYLIFEIINFLDFLFSRRGRSWKEYKKDLEYERDYSILSKAHLDPDFRSDTIKFYGISSHESGRKFRRILTYKLEEFLKVELKDEGLLSN